VTERRRALLELAAMLATGALQLVFENVLGQKIPYLLAVSALWVFYVGRRLFRERGLAAAWGLSPAAILPALPLHLGATALLFSALLGWRLWRGGSPLPEGAGLVFLVYPIWALVQEFALQCLLARNLSLAGLPFAAVVPLAAACFGAAHLPDLPLAGLTALAGLIWTPLFRLRPSLWPIALSHAWVGTLAFYWVLERDPWLEMGPP
jgi:hypothetical protein